MHKSKLIKLLKSLTADEFRRFKKLVLSPYFNPNEKVVKLYDSLRRFYPNFDDTKLTKESIFKKCFPKEKFNIAKLRRLMSEMTAVVEEYFVILEVRQKEYRQKKILVEAYGRRNLYDYFEKGTEELVEELESQPYRDGAFYLEMFGLKKAALNHPSLNRYDLSSDDFKKLGNYLDSHFGIEKLKLNITMKMRERLFKEEYRVPPIKNILLACYDQPFLENTTWFDLFSNLFQLQITGEEQYFFYIKSKFEKKFKEFSLNDQKDIWNLLLNYTIHQQNAGKQNFVEESFRLYQLGLENEWLMLGGYLRNITFTNVIMAAVKLEKFNWCYQFMHQYKTHLHPESKNDVFNYGLIFYFFSLKQYDKAIALANSIEFLDDLFQIKTRSILVKIYFIKFKNQDISYEQSLYSQIFSFEKYLKRNKLLATTRVEAHLKFIKILKTIVKHLYRNKLNFPKDELLDTIHNSSYIASKRWLLEQIQTL